MLINALFYNIKVDLVLHLLYVLDKLSKVTLRKFILL